uniref:TM6 n=1 Tax=Monotropa hypopitys TaxID=176248 RepID=A0A1Q1NA00_9ERIC|nr:TM6 [Monotropa hypopitys]
MGRGKIEIKRIENSTNRQVTYSKRRNGIFKKAQELSVLCDAKVSLIMFSKTEKFHEYITPSTTTKSIYDDYQKALGIDLWKTHYEKMQEYLRKLKEINNKLRREIRKRMGEDLNSLSIHELRDLQQEMDESLINIRKRKDHTIQTSTEKYKKKVRNLEERHGNLLRNFEARWKDPHEHGLEDDDDDGDYDYAVPLGNGVSNIFTFDSQHSHPHPNLHHAAWGSFGSHDLRLA